MSTNYRSLLKNKVNSKKNTRSQFTDNNSNIILEDFIKATINPRFLIQAPRGSLLISCDYAGQEMFGAARESNDHQMLNAFDDSVPDKIAVPSDYKGEYKDDEHLGDNPDKDLHTLSAMPAYEIHFRGKPSYEWCCIARNTVVTNGKVIRAIGKIINYGSLYLQSAQAMSNTHYVELRVAEQWVKSFQKAFPQFYEWQKANAKLGKIRGWAKDSMGRIRFCNESNSKASDNASERLAVNHMINLCPLN